MPGIFGSGAPGGGGALLGSGVVTELVRGGGGEPARAGGEPASGGVGGGEPARVGGAAGDAGGTTGFLVSVGATRSQTSSRSKSCAGGVGALSTSWRPVSWSWNDGWLGLVFSSRSKAPDGGRILS